MNTYEQDMALAREIALRVYDRHKTIMSFLMSLGVSEATAREDACKIEHDISEETFEALRRQLTN